MISDSFQQAILWNYLVLYSSIVNNVLWALLPFSAIVKWNTVLNTLALNVDVATKIVFFFQLLRRVISAVISFMTCTVFCLFCFVLCFCLSFMFCFVLFCFLLLFIFFCFVLFFWDEVDFYRQLLVDSSLDGPGPFRSYMHIERQTYSWFKDSVSEKI